MDDLKKQTFRFTISFIKRGFERHKAHAQKKPNNSSQKKKRKKKEKQEKKNKNMEKKKLKNGETLRSIFLLQKIYIRPDF